MSCVFNRKEREGECIVTHFFCSSAASLSALMADDDSGVVVNQRSCWCSNEWYERAEKRQCYRLAQFKGFQPEKVLNWINEA